MKGKDPDAHRGESEKGIYKGQAEIRVKIQAGVRIANSQTQGRSKIKFSENTNQSQSREVRITFNIKKIKITLIRVVSILQGGGVTEKTKKSNRPKQAENTRKGLTDKMLENRIQNEQETGNKNKLSRKKNHKNINDELAKIHQQVWT